MRKLKSYNKTKERVRGRGKEGRERKGKDISCGNKVVNKPGIRILSDHILALTFVHCHQQIFSYNWE